MARPSPFKDPEYTKQVADAFAAGLNRREMAEMFGVKDLDTITRWRRDPRVKSIVKKLLEDRVIQVTRKLDSRIEAILQHNLEELSIKEIVMLRRELLGGALRASTEKDDEATVEEAHEFLEKNPDFTERLTDLLEGKLPPAPTEV